MSNYVAFLDANVLVPACLRDTLLRLAEEPRLYLPKWSEQVIDETTSVLQRKLQRRPEETSYLVRQLREHFPEAWVEGYEPIIAAVRNHPGDRHVLAAAIEAGAQVIVTSNTRHFTEPALKPWGIEVQAPDDFLVHQFYLSPEIVIDKLARQAAAIDRTVLHLLATLRKSTPQFAELVRDFESS